MEQVTNPADGNGMYPGVERPPTADPEPSTRRLFARLDPCASPVPTAAKGGYLVIVLCVNKMTPPYG